MHPDVAGTFTQRACTLALLWSLLFLQGCARSAHDRELDRIFAHQAALRDTTGTLIGRVVDDSTGSPLVGVFVSSNVMGDMTDSAGGFLVPWVTAGSHRIIAEERGYLPDTSVVEISRRDTTKVEFRLRRAGRPNATLEGRWRLTLTLDSAGAGQSPRSRIAEGVLVLSPKLRSATDVGDDGDPWVKSMPGQYEIDLSPFWGTQVVAEVSTTVVGPIGPAFDKEAMASTFNDDSLTIDFIPRISHGGISLAGHIAGDTASGAWQQRAYCCGATGRFRLTRTSPETGPITAPPTPSQRPRDTLPVAERANVRVRIRDRSSSSFIKGFHALDLPDGSRKSVYTTGTAADGWGRAFWLPPGRYAIVISQYPCGVERYFLKEPIVRPFDAAAGEDVDITIELDIRVAQPSRSYNNTQGAKCATALPDSLRTP